MIDRELLAGYLHTSYEEAAQQLGRSMARPWSEMTEKHHEEMRAQADYLLGRFDFVPKSASPVKYEQAKPGNGE